MVARQAYPKQRLCPILSARASLFAARATRIAIRNPCRCGRPWQAPNRSKESAPTVSAQPRSTQQPTSGVVPRQGVATPPSARRGISLPCARESSIASLELRRADLLPVPLPCSSFWAKWLWDPRISPKTLPKRVWLRITADMSRLSREAASAGRQGCRWCDEAWEPRARLVRTADAPKRRCVMTQLRWRRCRTFSVFYIVARVRWPFLPDACSPR